MRPSRASSAPSPRQPGKAGRSEVLQERHPEAVEAFVALSLFPDGLPQEVAEAVTGSWALDRLYNYHLVQWHADRTFYPVPLGWYAQRRRAEHPVDENACRQRVLDGFAVFVEEYDRMVTGGAINAGIDRLIPEQNALQEIVEWAATHETATEGRSSAARIAAAAGNVLGLVHLHQLRSELTRSALEAALGAGDRLGEANCLQSLGRIALASGDSSAASRTFRDLLDLYREIRDGLGEQASLGYLARTAASAGRDDQAVALAERSLEVGLRISDRFGQTINLELQIGVWMSQENVAPALAAMLLYRDLCRQIGGTARAAQFEAILDQVLPSLPPEVRAALEEDPEAFRRAGVGAAEAALAEAGVDPLEPW